MKSLCNAYQLHSTGQTTGWIPELNDVNGLNLFQMTPAQVAVQAGDVAELRAIVNHPQFMPEKMGSLGVFFTICRDHSPERYTALRDYFDNEFRKNHHLDASRKVWVRMQ